MSTPSFELKFAGNWSGESLSATCVVEIDVLPFPVVSGVTGEDGGSGAGGGTGVWGKGDDAGGSADDKDDHHGGDKSEDADERSTKKTRAFEPVVMMIHETGKVRW